MIARRGVGRIGSRPFFCLMTVGCTLLLGGADGGIESADVHAAARTNA